VFCIDGGAGLGETAEQMIQAVSGDIDVLAYEPNPSNVSRFRCRHPRVQLVEAALGSVNGMATFSVTADTQVEGPNQYLQSGTSFVGKLGGATGEARHRWQVRVVRMESELLDRGLESVDFLKLDLQGGELDALNGLGSFAKRTKLMWIEFGGQPALLDWFASNNFTIFDTEYLFVGAPNALIRELFHINREGRNSIGKSIFFGTRRHAWTDYAKTFDFMQRHRRMIQTDLVAVNNDHLQQFLEVIAGSDANTSHEFFQEPPQILRSIR
jgi:FkbM family methyltransferase